MPGHEAQAVATNLLAALRFFGQARKDAEIRDLPDVSLIFCGLNYAAFNAALPSRPMDGAASELDRIIRLSGSQFDSKHVRWTCWLCDHFLSKPLRQEAQYIFGRHGLRPLTHAPGMYAERLAPPKRRLPFLEIRQVGDEGTRATFAEVMSVAFDIPISVSSAVYGSGQAWSSDFRGYIGYSNGRAVTTAAAMITGDVIGLYSVATLPQHRRLGFAEAIMRQVVEAAKQLAGIEQTVLQATASGLSLYEQMGYRTVTRFNVYIAD